MSFPTKYFIFALFLLALFSGCQPRSDDKIYTYPSNLLTLGEIDDAGNVARNLLKTRILKPDQRRRLDSIVEMCYRIKMDFTLTDSAVLKKLSRYNPTITTNDLLELVKEHKIDVRLLNGERRYFKRCISNLFLLDSTYAELKSRIEGLRPDSLPDYRVGHAAEIIAKTSNSGELVNPVNIKLSYTITVKPDAVPAGDTIRCWMPFPREGNPRQQNIHLLGSNPTSRIISPDSDLQRSIYLEKTSVANEPTVFHTEMEITTFGQSFQLTPDMILPYRKDQKLFTENTGERAPQIVFNNCIKNLTYLILQNETNPLLQVRKLYAWINDSVKWAGALEYCIIQDIPGFVMDTRHGDCGMQTLLFMSMARFAGIPVKWQSGWMLHPGHVNLHDWCEVYFEGVGWVPLDQSFGLQQSSDPRIREFYMTGMDSYRLIVNDDFSSPLTPAKKFFRSEPYDFQRGELEWKGGNLYFDQWSWDMEVTYK